MNYHMQGYMYICLHVYFLASLALIVSKRIKTWQISNNVKITVVN